MDMAKIPSASNGNSSPASVSTKCNVCMALGAIGAFVTAAAIITGLLLSSRVSTDGTSPPTSTSTTTGTALRSSVGGRREGLCLSSLALPFRARWNNTAMTVAGLTSTSGSASNLLNLPLCVQVDGNNAVYVVDGRNHRVQFWPAGSTAGVTVAGQASAVTGSNVSFLNYPTDLAVDSSGNVYVVDGGNSRVVLWTAGATVGLVVAGPGGYGTGNNQLINPLGLARDASTGTLYVADTGNHRVMRYASGASTGTLVAGGNGSGTGSSQLFNPRGLHYERSSSSLFIANNHGHNIVRWVVGASTWTLVAGSSTGVSGSTSLLLAFPTDVAVDASGNVYVTDEGNHRIQFFPSAQSNGSTVAGLSGSSGSTSSLLNTPASVALDSLGNIYVVDYGNARVQKFLSF